jgi:hypothetical protein
LVALTKMQPDNVVFDVLVLMFCEMDKRIAYRRQSKTVYGLSSCYEFIKMRDRSLEYLYVCVQISIYVNA